MSFLLEALMARIPGRARKRRRRACQLGGQTCIEYLEDRRLLAAIYSNTGAAGSVFLDQQVAESALQESPDEILPIDLNVHVAAADPLTQAAGEASTGIVQTISDGPRPFGSMTVSSSLGVSDYSIPSEDAGDVVPPYGFASGAYQVLIIAEAGESVTVDYTNTVIGSDPLGPNGSYDVAYCVVQIYNTITREQAVYRNYDSGSLTIDLVQGDTVLINSSAQVSFVDKRRLPGTYSGSNKYAFSKVDWRIDGESSPTIGMKALAVAPDSRSVEASYEIRGGELGSPADLEFYWADGPDSSHKIGDPVVVPTQTAAGVHAAAVPVEALGRRPPTATYIVAEIQSADADVDNPSAAAIAPAAVFTASYGWDVARGGITFGYTVLGAPQGDIPIRYYWSSDADFDAGEDTLAASSYIDGDGVAAISRLVILHVDASQIAAPPQTARYLLSVVDFDHDVLGANGSEDTVFLDYEPFVLVTSKYGGGSSSDVMGRYLAIPGVITDETMVIQLSDDLAALRPTVAAQVKDALVATPHGREDLLFTHPRIDPQGAWDGRSYETDEFDPGSLPGTTSFLTQAVLGGEVLARRSNALEVVPVPGLFSYLGDGRSISFVPGVGQSSGTPNGSYVLSGLVAVLSSSKASVIPPAVPYVGGKAIVGEVGLGIDVTIPLDKAVAPTVSGYAAARVVFDGGEISSTRVTAGVPIDGIDAELNVVPSFTLDPESLEPDGGVGVAFEFSTKGGVAGKNLFTRTKPVSIFLATYSVLADIAYDLKAQALLTLTPGSGFQVDAGATALDLGVSSTIRGVVDIGWKVPDAWLSFYTKQFHTRFPKLFPSATQLPSIVWKNAVSGTLAVHTTMGYSGSVRNLIPSVMSVEGLFDIRVTTAIQFTIGSTSVLGTDPFNVLPFLFDEIPKGGFKFRLVSA